jgi:hypothetical protein
MPVSSLPTLLELIRVEMERRAGSLESWLIFWTAFVALGLLYEYLYDLKMFERAGFNKVTKLVHVGAAMVTIGVAGELYVEVVAPIANEAVRRFDKATFSALQLETTKAQERASQLGIDLVAAKSALEKELQATARAQKAAADAQKDLNRFIFSRIVGRRVQSGMSEYLKKLSVSSAEIWYRAESEEVAIFANNVRDSLKEAGWKVPPNCTPISPNRFREGDLNFSSGVAIVTAKQNPSVPFATQSPLMPSSNWDLPKGILMTAQMFAGMHGAKEASEIDIKYAIGLA